MLHMLAFIDVIQ